MPDKTLLALFPDIDPTATAIEKLHDLGLRDDQVEVISGVPVIERILGRPRQWTNVTRLALGGAAVGFLTAGFLNFGTPRMYAVPVGGQPLLPIPPGLILFFELTMLFMLLATFLGVFLDSYFPNYRPLHYVPEISDGKFGVFFKCPAGEESRFTDAMRQLGAESVKPAEAIHL
jgi:hypothetical protein